MDSTEANPDVAANGPDRSETAPPRDAVEAAPAGDAAPLATATGEPALPTQASDTRPRPRRRRRRRHRAMPAPASGETLPAGEAQSETPPDAVPAATTDAAPDGEGAADEASQRPILRLPNRRRRRRRPRALGLLPGPAENMAETGGAAPAAAESEMAGAAPEPASRPATPPGQRSFRAPRRRRRHAPLSAAPALPSSAEAAASDGPPAAAPAGEPGTRPRRPRNRRRGISPGSPGTEVGERRQRADGSPGAAATPRGRDGGRPDQRQGDRQHAGGERRDRGPRDRRDRRDGPPGRGRGPAAPRQVERKLYSLDSVVDRGFDDVDEEAGTRRVHWTILKRTTADQISRKALSAVYVLQRDGADSEFPNLGAARAAVNKTIVHPEKLTRSKAEYAAEKAGKK